MAEHDDEQLSPTNEADLKEAIREAGKNLEELFDQAREMRLSYHQAGRFHALAVTNLEQSLMWIDKALSL